MNEFEIAIGRMGIRTVQNSLCLMLLKHSQKRLAATALRTTSPSLIASMVRYIAKKERKPVADFL